LYDLSEREKDGDAGWESVVGEMVEDIDPKWYCIDDCLLIPVRCPIPVALNALQQAKDESP
jgi:hypothetical protein